MDEPKKVRIAFLDAPTTGLAWHGRGITVEPGAYRVAEIDHREPGMVMLRDPEKDRLLAMVQESSIDEIREVPDIPYAIDWAAYYRAHPEVIASWG